MNDYTGREGPQSCCRTLCLNRCTNIRGCIHFHSASCLSAGTVGGTFTPVLAVFTVLLLLEIMTRSVSRLAHTATMWMQHQPWQPLKHSTTQKKANVTHTHYISFPPAYYTLCAVLKQFCLNLPGNINYWAHMWNIWHKHSKYNKKKTAQKRDIKKFHLITAHGKDVAFRWSEVTMLRLLSEVNMYFWCSSQLWAGYTKAIQWLLMPNLNTGKSNYDKKPILKL